MIDLTVGSEYVQTKKQRKKLNSLLLIQTLQAIAATCLLAICLNCCSIYRLDIFAYVISPSVVDFPDIELRTQAHAAVG